MPLNGFLKLPDIDGESKSVGHEDEIDIQSISWGMSQTPGQAPGRTRSHPVVSPVTLGKRYDASSPYLALASFQGRSFDEVVISFRKDSGDAHLDYLVITLTNVVVSSYGLDGGPEDAGIGDQVQLSFETVNVRYTVQADDHSAGDEHEIEFDVVAGT